MSGRPSRRRGLLALFFSISLLGHGVFAEEKPCTVHANGKYYDLNPLKASKDYEIKTPTGQTLSLNVCQNVKSDMFGFKDGQASDVGGFVRRGHGDFSIGKLNTSLSVFNERPRYTMSDGSRCKLKAGEQAGDIRASTLVEFVCDTSIFATGAPQLLAQLPPGDEESACAFVIEWRTPYACATSESGGFWSFIGTLAVVSLVLLLTYTILGVLYNRFVLDLRGYDQIPQFSFESMKYHGMEAYEWTRDMIGIMVLNLGSRDSGGGYSGPSSGNPQTPNPVSHQAQFSGFGGSEDVESGMGVGNGGFIRPQPGKNRAAAFQRHETNPVSHQSQVAQSLSFSAPLPPQSMSPHPQDASSTRGPVAESRSSTKDEREFMLGDDEDAEELVDVKPPPVPTEQLTIGPVTPTVPSTADVPNPGSAGSAAVARGRDLGEGETTYL